MIFISRSPIEAFEKSPPNNPCDFRGSAQTAIALILQCCHNFKNSFLKNFRPKHGFTKGERMRREFFQTTIAALLGLFFFSQVQAQDLGIIVKYRNRPVGATKNLSVSKTNLSESVALPSGLKLRRQIPNKAIESFKVEDFSLASPSKGLAVDRGDENVPGDADNQKAEKLKQIMAELKKNPDVQYVEVDEVITGKAVNYELATDPALGMNLIGATGIEGLKANSKVRIAIIDSGCCADGGSNCWTNTKEIPDNRIDDDNNGYVDDVHGWNFRDGNNDLKDTNGHGSSVSNIIAGLGDKVEVICLKALDDNLNGSVSGGVEAIQYAIDNGAKIVNLSWGYTSTVPSQILSETIQDGGGTLFAMSAGNNWDGQGRNNDSTPSFYPSSFNLPNRLAVAALDRDGHLADYSDFGPTTVDVAAPGFAKGIVGTSAAAPYVSLVAGSIWIANPEMSSLEVKKLMLDNVTPNSSLEGKVAAGGTVNLAKALAAAPSGNTLTPSAAQPVSGALPIAGSGASSGCALSFANEADRPAFSFLLLSLYLSIALVGLRKSQRK